MPGKIILTEKVWKAMRRAVNRGAPLEACGLLAGKNDRVERTLGVHNAERSPVRFRMEPRAQWRAFQRIEAAGLELVGIYHSHPNGPDRPSPTDIAQSMYPVTQVIWFRVNSEWRARGFQIEGGNVIEITLEISKPQ
jgi:proteasome lid subunit RPN8/RPN11